MSPIERAARALAAEEHRSKDFAPPWWSEDGEPNGDCITLSDDDKQRYRSCARTVLTAIRDIDLETEDDVEISMLVEGAATLPEHDEPLQADALACWRAMIDASISDA